MSIPKEPRQLMINLMYLVLTAILALNVSAEVLNAFFTIDESLTDSSNIVQRSNEQLFAAIEKQAVAYTQYEPYLEKVKEARTITRNFVGEVQALRNLVMEEAGGPDEHGEPKRKKDKDIPTRLLVNEGKGDALKNQILEAREALLSLIEDSDDRAELADGIPLNVNPSPDKGNWAQYTFQQLPVAAVMPMLGKWQNDAKIAETTILNYYLKKMDNVDLVPDEFAPVLSADKSYVIRGEEFTGEIFLAAYSTTADNIRITVDGREYPVENGKAIFKARPNGTGERLHTMEIELTNPITGEVKQYQKQFRYEVGERSVTVSADKMNVLYVGVDNPISVSAAGIPSGKMKVRADGTDLTNIGPGKFIAKPQRTGEAKITVSGGGLDPMTFKYRVKRIPDPVLKLGNKSGGSMSKAEFKAQLGIIPRLEGFDFEARCEVISFDLARVPKNDDARVVTNRGGSYGSDARSLVDAADHKDVYYFDDVKVKCPGDRASRNINGMIFNIK